MLPKVATHILHHTSRAAATAHNYTFRNVLGLQSSTPSTSTGGLANWNGTGSSSWGGHGAGPGGAKYNTGSRFYNGYTGAGRAVTQANSSTAHDSNSGQTDDTDDIKPQRAHRFLHTGPRSRPRSSSLSLGTQGRNERAETLGVLKTVQLHHARARHTFADTSTTQDGLLTPAAEPTSPAGQVTPSSRPVIVRRNSTSTSASRPSIDFDVPPPPAPSKPPVPQLAPTDPAAPQTTLPPTPPPSDEDFDDSRIEDYNAYERLKAAKQSRDLNRVTTEVLNFRTLGTQLGTAEYNMALQALLSARTQGQPINMMLETYNEMLARQVIPNIRTYKILILALCDRDKEVQKVITQLQVRMKRRTLMGRQEVVQHATDSERIAQLKEEDNFSSAMTLFQAAANLDPGDRTRSLSLIVYTHLLRSCAFAANIDAAISVFAHVERAKNLQPDAVCYLNLLSTFVNAGDIDGAKDVFEEFRRASTEGRVFWDGVDQEVESEGTNMEILGTITRTGKARGSQITVWNKMIEGYFRAGQPEKAISVLEEMMDTKAGLAFGPADVPPPCPATYTAFTAGFTQLGDVKSALAWFDRMLVMDTFVAHPLEPTLKPPRPHQHAWSIMLEGLAEKHMLDDLNRLFRTLMSIADRDGLEVRAIDRVLVFEANFMYLKAQKDISDTRVDEILSFLLDGVMVFGAEGGRIAMGLEGIRQMAERLIVYLAETRKYDRAMTLLEDYVAAERKYLEANERKAVQDSEVTLFQTKGVRNLVLTTTPMLLLRSEDPQTPVSLEFALRFAQVSDIVGLSMGRPVAAYYLHAYYQAKEAGEPIKLTAPQWSILTRAAANLAPPPRSKEGVKEEDYPRPDGFQFPGIMSFIEDLRHNGVNPRVDQRAARRIFASLWEIGGKEKAVEVFESLGKDWSEVVQTMITLYEQADRVRSGLPIGTTVSDTTHLPTAPVHIDIYHGRYIDEWFPYNPKVTVQMAWGRYEAGVARRVYPPAEVIGRLIQAFGRLGDAQKLHRLYQDAQAVLARLEDDKHWQSLGWYAVEDQMIIGLAHCGDMEAAHTHRQRILEHGGSPSGDAYGALIQLVKETSDDSSNALALWQESQLHKVTPNIYLYNTIISKLSKARKADFALELFQQMKANYIRPTSVTYGAVIAACSRVGDVHSAELLFEEMTAQPNFKPRIPPFNTMIQLYTQMKPDRERALHYFNELLRVGISPTAHTYKLLLDCYGTIEPVDIASMQDVFERLIADPAVKVQGVHWAALINAWGCYQKDLDATMKIFDSIETQATTVQSRIKLPDAIVYESMMNVLVTLHRYDLIPTYAERLTQAGVHMTAYIANLMIKGYAAEGNLDRARGVFEGLADPPLGMAAPNNHTPHDSSKPIASGSPVYREPSTWEAMVRAELGNGNRGHAESLLQRAQARHFPQAVFQRISGIMHDETSPVFSMAPWLSADTSPTSA